MQREAGQFSKERSGGKPGSGAEGHGGGQSVRGSGSSAFSPGDKSGSMDLGPAGFSGALNLVLLANLFQDSQKEL